MKFSQNMEASGSFNASTEYLLEQRRHYKERRRFLLFSGFDPALMAILWVIFTVTKGPDWRKDFSEQCNFQNNHFFMVSLFDILILSVVRFFWLVIWYGCCCINHWWPVSISTAFSSTFLLTKVIYFFLETKNQASNPLAYAIPICSFVIAWVELYLLDLEVLIKEVQPVNETVSDVERGPAAARHLPSGHVSDYLTATELSSESDDEEHERTVSTANQAMKRVRLITKGGYEYKSFGRYEFIWLSKKAMGISKYLYSTVEGWPLRKSSPLIRSDYLKDYGRFFYLKIDTKVPVEALFDILYTKSQAIPKWNPLVLQVKTIMAIDNFTDVSHSISAPAMMNYIAARDFLDVRYYEQTGRTYHIATVFVRSDLKPPSSNPKLIRGENGPCLCILKPSATDENCSSFEWIMNTDLKGNLPKKLVERSLIQFLCKFAGYFEARLKLPP